MMRFPDVVILMQLPIVVSIVIMGIQTRSITNISKFGYFNAAWTIYCFRIALVYAENVYQILDEKTYRLIVNGFLDFFVSYFFLLTAIDAISYFKRIPKATLIVVILFVSFLNAFSFSNKLNSFTNLVQVPSALVSFLSIYAVAVFF